MVAHWPVEGSTGRIVRGSMTQPTSGLIPWRPTASRHPPTPGFRDHSLCSWAPERGASVQDGPITGEFLAPVPDAHICIVMQFGNLVEIEYGCFGKSERGVRIWNMYSPRGSG